jgi:hypothetical protein
MLQPNFHRIEDSSSLEGCLCKGRLRAIIMPSWHGFRYEESEVQLAYRARELGFTQG